MGCDLFSNWPARTEITANSSILILIMVRGRLRSHLAALKERFPDPARGLTGTDYAFRIFVDTPVWSQVLSGRADGTDHDKFKSKVVRNQGKKSSGL